MRRRAFFACCLAARGQPSPNSTEPAPVLFFGPTQLPQPPLGQIPEGQWAVCPASTALKLTETRPPRILYFDRYEYNNAIAGLHPANRDEAIRFRLRTWTPRAQGNLVQRLFDIQAALWESAPTPAAMARLQKLAGLDRYAMTSVDGMAVAMLEAESRLLAELPPGPARTSRERWAALALRTTKATAGTLPKATLTRGVFVQGQVAARESLLHGEGVPVVRWRDGLVFPATATAQSAPLYEDGALLEDTLELSTQAQRERDFAARLARTPQQRERDHRQFTDRLALQQLLLKRALCLRTNCQTIGVAAALAEEEQALARSAAANKTFLTKLGWPQPPSQARANAEANLLQTWAKRHWPNLVSALD